MKATFAFYTSRYKSEAISEDDWPYYEAKASAQLRKYKNEYTVSVPEDYDAAKDPDPECMAICAMADSLQAFDQILSGDAVPARSLSVGSVSESYGFSALDSLDVSPKGQAKELYRNASMYLDIYRGVT